MIYCHSRLRSRLAIISAALRRSGIERTTARRIDRFARNEGLVSALWQAWNHFSRSTVILSAQGTLTSTGSRTNSQYSYLSESELLFVCREAAYGNPIRNIKPLLGNHLEPTWGDARRINRIISTIQPSNEISLITGFGLRSISLDLQSVRNACSHISSDRINDIVRMKVRYADTYFRHPSDVLFWTEPSTGSEAWRVWIDELLASAERVTQ